MKCNFEMLCMYLDNILDEEKRKELIAHLERCEICKDAVAMMSQDRNAEPSTANRAGIVDIRARAV